LTTQRTKSLLTINAQQVCFLQGTDQTCCKAAVDELNGNCVLGEDVCPAGVPADVMVLTNRRGHGGFRQRQVEGLSGGWSAVSFAQESKQGRDRSKVQCHNFNLFGQMAKNCKTALNNQESKCGGSDDNDSAGSGGGKAVRQMPSGRRQWM